MGVLLGPAGNKLGGALGMGGLAGMAGKAAGGMLGGGGGMLGMSGQQGQVCPTCGRPMPSGGIGQQLPGLIKGMGGG